MNALRYLLNFLCGLILYPFAFQRIVFWKLDDANQPNQPTSQKPIKIDNFYKNCLIWLKLGMQVSHSPCSLLPAPAHHYCPPLPPLPTVTAPAHPFFRFPQYFSDFFLFWTIVLWALSTEVIFHLAERWDGKKQPGDDGPQNVHVNGLESL